MISGFDTALGEVTLVLFTTLAPSGAVALVLVAAAVLLLLLFSKLEPTMRARISTFMCIPLVVTMVGLVASATHLGNPANALYVFLHFGSSPLSRTKSSVRWGCWRAAACIGCTRFRSSLLHGCNGCCWR